MKRYLAVTLLSGMLSSALYGMAWATVSVCCGSMVPVF